MRGRPVVQVALAVVLVATAPVVARAEHRRPLGGTVEALLALPDRPLAIGHRGSGANDPAHPSRPIENTVASVRKAFKAELTVIEIDVQLTRDRHVVAYHDDVLPDFTCLNTLTLRELKARVPLIATLEAVLDEAGRFNRPAGPLRGLVIIELKAVRPLCDPDDRQDHPMVQAATHVVRHMRMTRQILFTSFSPAMLDLARIHAPEIARILAVSGLQFLTREEAAAWFRTTVTVIDKRHGMGLEWAEVGTLFRLPGYRSFAELVRTALLVDARVVEADLLLLLDPRSADAVPALHRAGLKVFGFTVDDATQWTSLASLGVDAIYTNDIAIGLALQAFIP